MKRPLQSTASQLCLTALLLALPITSSQSPTNPDNIVPGNVSWLGDYGDGDGTPDIADHFPITYTLFGDNAVAIPRIVVPLDQDCPLLQVDENYQSEDDLPEVKLRVQGDFNLPRAFPVRVCEVRLSTDEHKQAWSNGSFYFDTTDPNDNVRIPTDPERILIYGDTGLRVKPTNLGIGTCKSSDYELYGIPQCPFNFTEQDVNLTNVGGDFQSLSDWHFDDMVTLMAEQHETDLAIHVGDYVYRQGPCPTQLDGQGNCVGINGPSSFSLRDLDGTVLNWMPGNWGDNLLGWWSDFFYPAQTILKKVPMIALRGNHENCERAGHGYFFFLDVFEYEATQPGAEYCKDYIAPFSVPFENEQYLVQDSSDVDEKDGGIDHFQFVEGACPSPPSDGSLVKVTGANRYDAANPAQTDAQIEDQVGIYEKEMLQMAAMAERYETNILLTHRPMFAVGCNNTQMVALDWTLERTVTPSLLTNISAVISGHMHWLEVLEFEDATLPTQVVVGHGGTKLIPNYVNQDIFPYLELQVGYQDKIHAKVKNGLTNSTSFGFGIMARNEEGDYDTTFYNYNQESNETDTLEYSLVLPRTRPAPTDDKEHVGIDDSGTESQKRIRRRRRS